MKKLLVLILMISAIFLLSACVSEEQLAAVDPNSKETVIVEIPEGSTANDISKILEEQGLISSRGAFLYYLKKNDMSADLKAGKFELSKAYDVAKLAEIIASGETYKDTVTVLIPEGYEFREIVDKLEKETGIDKEEFIRVANEEDFGYAFIPSGEGVKYRLEGYLFPATYTFARDADAKVILGAMLQKFDEVFNEEYYKRAEELGLTVNQVITMASIVEREGADLEEFPRIAGVFYNRIKDQMLFQSCATVQYIIEERKPNLLFSDLEIESPYNTYKNAGMPPGPIASPGEAAIKAALYPEEHKYYYFVVTGDNDGKHVFSETLEEHETASDKAYDKMNE